MTVLSACEAYRFWASTYAAETATSFLDEKLAQEMLAGRPRGHLLDAGCGTGRRIAGMRDAVGIDASVEMLAAGGLANILAGDIRALPFEDDSFDSIWCRLVLGHIADPLPAYHELARVCKSGGHVFVTDFHSDAVAAGNLRSFRDQSGQVHVVEHYVHNDHPSLAAVAKLSLTSRRDATVGSAVRPFFEKAGRSDLYERQFGLALVAGFLFEKQSRAPED